MPRPPVMTFVPAGDPAAERGGVGVDAGVHHGDGRVLAVVGDAQGAEVAQADQAAAGRVGQVGRGLELPDALVVGGVEDGAVGREADAQRGIDEAGGVLGPRGVEALGELLTRPVGEMRMMRPPKSFEPPVVLPLVMTGIDVARRRRWSR